jgi:hypothetical protein
MNDQQSKFQSRLLMAIVGIIFGILILVGLEKPISDIVAAMLNTTLSGLLGALGGHAISAAQQKTIEGEKP